MSNKLLGYRINEEVYASKNARVYRAHRLVDDAPVILKTPNTANPTSEQIAQFEREFQLNQALNMEGLVQVYELAYDDHRPVLVVEDFGAHSLATLYRNQMMPLDLFWPLAVRVVQVLSELHRQHVIHKDINPANVLYNPESKAVKLTDLGIASRLSRETPKLANVHMLEGTLPYLAPEQTGRMNRDVDYRADFYALGATFYELLTGEPPFAYTTAEELVHAHLAETPLSPHEKQPQIPRILSDIVMRLLAKNAEERYQLAYGLQADLVECWSRWTASKYIEPFELGQYDISDQFQLPQGLYGRTAEIGLLEQALATVQAGGLEIIYIGGEAGIGKSALVGELNRVVATSQGYFASSRFDLFQRSEPYQFLLNALRQLVRQMLSESEAQLQAWRETLTAVFTAEIDTHLLTSHIPELAPIIGTSDNVWETDDPEPELIARRLHLLLGKLLEVVTRSGRPLVLFVDDVQWADSASLRVLAEFLTTVKPHGFFFITAYRQEEVNKTHPLRTIFHEALQQAQLSVREINLAPLAPVNVTQYVADTLRREPVEIAELSQLIIEKTGGNPFFLGVFLQELYRAGHLIFDPQETHWVWDVAQIASQEMTDNVIELLARKVTQLPASTQRMVQLAAIIGNEFDFGQLRELAQQQVNDTAVELWPAIEANLVQPLDETYRLLEGAFTTTAVPEVTVRFRFVHDRVQQAAYGLLSAEARAKYHWRMGNWLWESLPPEERAGEPQEELFNLVNHLNAGQLEMQTEAQKWWLVRLNWLAGRRARQATAYEVAFDYLHTAVSLLPAGMVALQQAPEMSLCQNVYAEATEAALLTNQHELMQTWAETALALIPTAVGRAPIYALLMQAHSLQREYKQATDIGLHAIAELGLPLSATATTADIAQEMAAVRQIWQTQDILSLVGTRPISDDRRILNLMRLLQLLNTCMPFAYPPAYPLVPLAQVRLSLQHDPTPYAADAFIAYGITLLADEKDIEAGYQFARLALTVARRYKKEHLVQWSFNALIRFWREPLARTLDPLLELYTTLGVEGGDYFYGMLSTLVHFLHALWHGRELQTIETGLVLYEQESVRFKSTYLTSRFRLYRQMVRALMGHTAELTSLSTADDDPMADPDERYDETAVLANFEAINDHTSVASWYCFKLQLHYLYEEYDEAEQAATAVAARLGHFKSAYWVIIFNVYHSLTLLAQALKLDPDTAVYAAKIAQVNQNQAQLAQWQSYAPHNFELYWQLVEAERCRLLPAPGQARLHYEKAISLAREHGYMNIRALAHERAGHFFIQEGQEWLARFFLSEAHYAYTRWGAHGKADWLRSVYPSLVVPNSGGNGKQDITTTRIRATISHSTSRGVVSTALDLAAITRASQAIASEVVPDRLQSRMMQVVLENAGAQRGLLLMPPLQRPEPTENEAWVIQVEGLKRGNSIETRQGLAMTAEQLPLALVNYVIRTQESVVLGNALRDDPVLAADPYVQAQQLRSALCLPLINRGRLVGVLYLENNLASNAFTDDHVGMLHILASQTAVSLDNARLYAGLENMVAERTQELEQAVAELDAFAHTVAHDLKSPLSGMLGYADMLKELDDELNPAERQEIFDRLIRGGIHMRDIIDALLLLAQTRHDTVQTEPIGMGQLVEEVLGRFYFAFEEKKVTISQPEEWPTVLGYAPWVAEVWANYISNGVKYGGKKPHIILGHEPWGEGFVRFWVQDHGRGMTPEEQDQIFAPFVKVGQRTGDSHGLGLSIARRITERLGGEVGVTSSEGQGSTFYFSLPLASEK